MKNRNKWIGLIVGAATSLTISSTVMADPLPIDNRLPAWDDYGTETVDFGELDIFYQNGKKKRGVIGDTVFFAESNRDTTFNLNGPDDRGTAFDGYMVVDAKLSSRGRLKAGSTFSIFSAETKFDDGSATTPFNCKGGGSNCENGWLVYGGDLTSFGWSGTAGILEFTIANLSGWALDAWTDGDMSAAVEHLYINTPSFDLGGVSSVKKFEITGINGFAVVPVPAAAWLFGSGLIGLVGVARRKRG